MMKTLGLGGAALAAVLFVLPSTAAAQGYPPPPPGGGGMGPPPAMGPTQDARGFWPRYGLYGGVGLGAGSLTFDCEGCPEDSKSAFGFQGNVGYALNPQLGIILDIWGQGRSEDFGPETATVVNALVTVGAQFWITPMLWIKGGIGSGQLSVTLEDGTEISETDPGPAFMAAIGFEVLHSPNFSVDLELRVGAAGYEDGFGDAFTATSSGLFVSANWHQLWLRPPPIQ